MLRSMTGQGQARSEVPLGVIGFELRTVNNRHLKVTSRLSDALTPLEGQIERTLRSRIRRGTIQVNATFQPKGLEDRYRINTGVLRSFYTQIANTFADQPTPPPIDMGQLCMLPGIVEVDDALGISDEALWELVEPVLIHAIQNLDEMRASDAVAMRDQLLTDHQLLRERLTAISGRTESVIDYYRQKLLDRVEKFLQQQGVEYQTVDLLKEVQVYADRSDISEEVTRLGSHLDLFLEVLENEEPAGRKLDFVIQEMFRETNTIGSKGNDAEIARHVVDIKCAIERMRELVQNLE